MTVRIIHSDYPDPGTSQSFGEPSDTPLSSMEQDQLDSPDYAEQPATSHDPTKATYRDNTNTAANAEGNSKLRYTIARENDPFGVIDQKLIELARMENVLLASEFSSEVQRAELRRDLEMKKKEVMEVLKQMLPGQLSGVRNT